MLQWLWIGRWTQSLCLQRTTRWIWCSLHDRILNCWHVLGRNQYSVPVWVLIYSAQFVWCLAPDCTHGGSKANGKWEWPLLYKLYYWMFTLGLQQCQVLYLHYILSSQSLIIFVVTLNVWTGKTRPRGRLLLTGRAVIQARASLTRA